MSRARAGLAVLVVAVMGCAILGIGVGESPAERERPPGAAGLSAARERLAAGDETVRAGERLFAEQGCDRCHTIAATGASGRLGPRLDTRDDDIDELLESIEQPRADTADGYPERLMPVDFGERLNDDELLALALFLSFASGGEPEDEDDGGQHGRGGGRSGSG